LIKPQKSTSSEFIKLITNKDPVRDPDWIRIGKFGDVLIAAESNARYLSKK
jgi:hypothetical protein